MDDLDEDLWTIELERREPQPDPVPRRGGGGRGGRSGSRSSRGRSSRSRSSSGFFFWSSGMKLRPNSCLVLVGMTLTWSVLHTYVF